VNDIFRDASLETEDLLLLEDFQIAYLEGGMPEREFAAVLHAHPEIGRFLAKRCPRAGAFVERVVSEHAPARDDRELATCSEKVLRTIRDLLCYNRCPEVYDAAEFHNWPFTEVTDITSLAGKVVVDGGAGTGRVALEAAESAKWVFAVEPVTRLRRFVREKAKEACLDNLFVTDGFLHAIPLPGDFADVLITSHALGWKLSDELAEFERVVRGGGFIIHCPGTADRPTYDAVHETLVSAPWNYEFGKYRESDGRKRKYWKEL